MLTQQHRNTPTLFPPSHSCAHLLLISAVYTITFPNESAGACKTTSHPLCFVRSCCCPRFVVARAVWSQSLPRCTRRLVRVSLPSTVRTDATPSLAEDGERERCPLFIDERPYERALLRHVLSIRQEQARSSGRLPFSYLCPLFLSPPHAYHITSHAYSTLSFPVVLPSPIPPPSLSNLIVR